MKKQFFKLLKKCFLTGLFFVLMGMQYAFAQQTVTGTITDENDSPVPGANILVRGTTTGTQTDFDGNYSIEASPEDVLAISYIGYATQNITVGDQTTINAKLETDFQQLDDVVVIGYGTVSKKDVTGSVSQVTSKSFEDQPLVRVEDALQGRASGVAVARANGAPGAGIKIRIRGSNSITGSNDPLVVIDGVIGGDLSTLNPNDIAAMDVLKDASATAIYGVRGSNGVIIVTTKKGSGKPKVDIDFFTTVSTVPKLLPTLGAQDFARIENGRRIRNGGTGIFTDAEISALGQGVNYQDEFLRTGVSKNLQMSVSGSEGPIRYFISGNYVDQEGIVINTGYERYSLRANTSVQVNDKLNVGLNVFAVRATTKNDLNTFGRFQGSDIVKAITWDPTTPIFNADGEYNIFSEKGLASLNYNPIANLKLSSADEVQDRLNVNLNMKYDITKNLSYNLVIGVGTTNANTQRYITEPPIPDATFNSNKNTSHQVSNVLTWQKDFGNHSLKLTGLYEFQGNENRNNFYAATNLSVPAGFYFASLNANASVNNNFTYGSLQSYMGRAEYILNDALFFTATMRADQSSVFAKDNRTGYFPSAALAYSINGLSGDGFISNAKLRAGWGQVGNAAIAPYSRFPSVNANSTYSFNGTSPSPGSSPDGFGNADVTWETTSQTNVGVDLGLFGGKASLTIDAYQKNTTDLLLRVPVSDTDGGGFVFRNVGEVQNRGIDVALGADLVSTDSFNWNSNFNFSYSKNEVLSLFNDLEEIQGTFGSTDGQSRRWNVVQVGQPLGQLNGSTFLGTYKTSEAAEAEALGFKPGDAKYLRDAEGNRVIGAIGNGTPTTFWGWNNTLNYKNWDLNVFVQGVHGFDVLNAVQGTIVGGTGNQRSFLAPEQLNQWTPGNETDIPAGGENDYGSTRYVEDGSFIRLSNVTLGYTLRNFAKTEATVKLYASGQNLFLLTDYTGYDPEHTSRPASNNDANAFAPDAVAGINAGAYPNPRTFNLGVKIGF